MFQDEARFGRMVRIRRCWSPSPMRPIVENGYERQFVYVYGAVSLIQGELDWMICREMNTVRMNEFLLQVSQAHSWDFIIMIVDGASSHRSKDLNILENIRFVALPGYSPELNPQEHVWDELREKEFPNRVFADLDSVVAPYNRDSGSTVGQRSIYGGRAEVRSALYMATLTAIRSNRKIKEFYKKLVSKGKKKKVALVACMRKFLVCLNAMLKTNKSWSDNPEPVRVYPEPVRVCGS
jgi:hypothetical protein